MFNRIGDAWRGLMGPVPWAAAVTEWAVKRYGGGFKDAAARWEARSS